MGTELIWTRSCWGGSSLKQQKPCWGFTEILLRFQCSLNLGKVLGKIWAGVMALTARNHTRIDIGSKSSKIWDVELIKSILTVVKEMKGFSDREITFLINVILEKQRTVSSIIYWVWNLEYGWHIKSNCHSQQPQALKVFAVGQARDQ